MYDQDLKTYLIFSEQTTALQTTRKSLVCVKLFLGSRRMMRHKGELKQDEGGSSGPEARPQQSLLKNKEHLALVFLVGIHFFSLRV